MALSVTGLKAAPEPPLQQSRRRGTERLPAWMALGTKWGLFRHYWVLFSFLLTIFANGRPRFSHAFGERGCRRSPRSGRTRSSRTWRRPRPSDAGTCRVVAIQVINVYKSQGMTPYGWRKQQKQRK